MPKLELFSVDPSKIVDIIGQAGKTIKEIIEKFDVSIDLDREKGEVKVAGSQKGKVEAAKEYIIQITQKDLKTRGGKKEVKNIDNFNNFYFNGTLEEWKSIKIYGSYDDPSEYANNFYVLDENNKYYKVNKK